MAIWIEHVYTFFSSSMFISFHLHVLPMFHIASVSQSSKRASAFACAMRKRLSRARRRAVRSEGSSPTSLALPRRRNVLQMQDTIRYARSRYPRYAGSSRKPVSGLKQKLQQHCGQWHCLGCWNLLNNVECTANVALAGSWVVPRYRCPLDQLRLHSFAFPSPDLFQTCSRLVTLTVTVWLIFKVIYGCDWSASQSGDLELRLVAKSQRARLLLPVPWSDSTLDVWESFAVSIHQDVITPVLVCVVWLVSVSVCKWIHSGYHSNAAQAPFFLALHHPGDRIVRSWSKVDHRPLMPLWSFMIL